MIILIEDIIITIAENILHIHSHIHVYSLFRVNMIIQQYGVSVPRAEQDYVPTRG